MPVTAKEIKEVREKTGAGMMECKTVLEETKGDIAQAVQNLKRRGLAIAEKKKDNATKAGLVGSYIHGNGKIGVLLELGCETDFVAKNETFCELHKHLCLQVAAMAPMVVSRNDLPKEIIDKEKEFYAQEVKGKPQQVVDKIVEGKLEKFFFTQKCLLDQPFIKDDSQKIGDLVKSYVAKFGENITVKRFVRFELGKD